MMIPPDCLRVRRYLDGELLDERAISYLVSADMAALDHAWALDQARAGRRPRIVIDDPAGDIDDVVAIELEPWAAP